MAANTVKNNQPRTTPLQTLLALEPPEETVVEVATDGLVVVEPALKVVMEPVAVEPVEVSTGFVRVVREGVKVVREPPLRVEVSNETTLLPGAEVTTLLPGAETVVVGSATVDEAGGTSEVGAGGATEVGAGAEHSAVTVT